MSQFKIIKKNTKKNDGIRKGGREEFKTGFTLILSPFIVSQQSFLKEQRLEHTTSSYNNKDSQVVQK